MSRDRQSEVHHGLQLWPTEVEHPIAQVEDAKGGDRSDETEDGGHTEHDAHVPGFGLITVADIVVGDRQDRSVVQQRQQHDLYRGDGKKLNNKITAVTKSRTRSVSAIR